MVGVVMTQIDIELGSLEIVDHPIHSVTGIQDDAQLEDGITTAANTIVKLTLDPGLTHTGDTASVTPVVMGNQVEWNFGNLSLSGGGNFDLQVSVPNDPLGTGYTSKLEINSDGPEADPDDDSTNVLIMIMEQIFLPSVLR